MRAQLQASLVLLALVAGCGGGSSSGSSGGGGVTPQQKEQALAFTSALLIEVTAYSSPDTFVPPALRPGMAAELAQAHILRGPSAPLLPIRGFILTPCAGSTITTGPDASGYFTATTDFIGCTDGTTGQVVTRWKLATDFFDLAVSFNAFSVQAVIGGTLVTETISGTTAVTSTHAGNVWTTHYLVPSLVADATGGGTSLHLTHTADMTATFTRTSALDQPVVGDYSVHGSSTWNDGLAVFASTIPQATPLLWKDLGSGTACPYPLSGRVVYTINGRSFGLTFTSVCGIVALDDGSSADMHNY
ncbi:MAG TPA: hypothetical protein VJ483_07100 [Holophagaceae bacterium]|nr:hypothetical protein [Holophagaceae bacterium]